MHYSIFFKLHAIRMVSAIFAGSILLCGQMSAQTAATSPLLPAAAKSADFRNVSWGQEYKSVLDSEKQKPAKEFPLGAICRAELAGEKCALVYLFINKGKTLTNAACYYHRSIDKAPMLGEIYAKLQAELTSQYGKPASAHVESDPPTAEQIQNLQSGKTLEGKAIVKTGDSMKDFLANMPVIFYCSYLSWETPRTSIRLDIEASTDGTIWLILLYTAKTTGNSKTAAATSDKLFSYTDADRYKDLIMSQARSFAGEDVTAKK